MREAFFLSASLALHALALAYPVSFRESGEAPVVVTLISRQESARERTGSPGSAPPYRTAGGVQPAAADTKRLDDRGGTFGQAAVEAKMPETARDGESETLSVFHAENDDGSLLALAGRSGSEKSSVFAAGDASRVGGAGPSSAGGGKADLAAGGSGGGRARFTPASYDYAPAPPYPEHARREGREGRVLLRVLVDPEGRSKTVEVRLSSGSDVLDRAAEEAVKRWRFVPARSGGRAVESWVNVPVEFRLTDSGRWPTKEADRSTN